MAVLNPIVRMQNRYRRSLSTFFGRRMVHLKSRFPIISFTFDDFPQSALRQGGAILKSHEARGTYYISLGLMGSEIPAGLGFSAEDLRQAVADEHELGCHTFAHCNAWETKPDVFEKSIVDNKNALEQFLSGSVFRTLSYPIDYPRPQTKRRAARHFVCCRGAARLLMREQLMQTISTAFFLEKSRDHPTK